MIKHTLLTLLLCLGCLGSAFPALASAPKQVTFEAVTGMGTTSKAARLDAFRNAIAQAVGVHVRADTLVENYMVKSDRVKTASQGFIQEFKLLNETHEQGIYTATYRIKVGTDLMATDFKKVMGTEFRNVGHPSVAVLSWTQSGEQISPETNQMAASTMNRALIQKGYKVVDTYQVRLLRTKEQFAAPQSADQMQMISRALANRLKADIYATAFVSQTQGRVQVLTRIYNSYTGQIFGEETAYAKITQTHSQAVAQAVEKTMDVLLKDIYQHWQDVLTQGIEYVVILDGYKTGQERMRFKDILKKSPGVTSVRQISVAGGKAEFSVYSSSTPSELFDSILSQALSQGLPIKNQDAFIRGGRALFLL